MPRSTLPTDTAEDLDTRLLRARFGVAKEAAGRTFDVEFGGVTLTVPGDPAHVTPEALDRMKEGFMRTPEFDHLIDKKSGAPARVRLLVGSAPEADKLANLRDLFPR